MLEFLEKEESYLQQLRKKYPDEADNFKTFLQSKYLPKQAKTLIGLAHTSKSEKSKMLISSVASGALNKFIDHYLNAVCILIDGIDPNIKSQEAENKFNLECWNKVIEEEPFLEWFIDEGIVSLNLTCANLTVTNLEQLARIVRTLDYLGSFLDLKDNQEISTLYDIPVRLNEEITRRKEP